MTVFVKRQTVALGPVSLYREYALHSRTKVPYVSSMGYKVNVRRAPSTLYLVVGLAMVSLMGMSMADPMTWVAMLLWPLVLIFKAFTIMVELALVGAVIVGLVVAGDKAYRAVRRHMR